MKIGYPLYYGHPGIAKGVELAASLGFDYVDLALDQPQMLEENIEEIRDALDSNSLEMGVQSPWESIFLGSVWDECVTGMMATILRAARFARDIGAVYTNVHLREDLGSFAWERQTRNRLISRAGQNLARLMQEMGRDESVTVETPPGGLFANLENFGQVVRTSQMAICLDIGHVLCTSHGDGAIIDKWVKTFGDRIVVAHLSGYREEGGAHFEPTERQFQSATSNLKKCSNLKYLLLESFRGFENLESRDRILRKTLHRLKRAW